MANALYDIARTGMLTGSINWLTDEIRVKLVASPYAASLSSETSISSIAASLVVATSCPLTGKFVNAGIADAANTTIASVSGSNVHYLVVYDGTPSASIPLAYIDGASTSLPLTPDGTDITLGWSDNTNRIFSLGSPSPNRILPASLLSTAGTVVEGFETASGWTVVTGSLVADTTYYRSGSAGVKITSTSSTTGEAWKTVNLNLSTACTLRMDFYVHNQDAFNNLYILLTPAGGYGYYYRAVTYGSTIQGWNTVNLRFTTDFSTGGPLPAASNVAELWLRTNPRNGSPASVTFDKLQLMPAYGTPAVMLTFDDAKLTVFENAYPVMAAHNIRGTVYTITDNVNDGDADTMCASQLQALQAAGWCIANHSKTHTNFTTLTQAQIETELTSACVALTASGLTGGRHVAYPYGGYDADSDAAMTATSMLTGRTTLGVINDADYCWDLHPLSQPYRLRCYAVYDSASVAALKTEIDLCKAQGRTLDLLFHEITTTDTGTNWLTSEFTELIEYIVSENVACITIPEFYALASSAVNIPQTN